MIIRECSASTPNARRVEYCGHIHYVEETHAGLVLGTYEKNGYDDSDFFAIVWDDEIGMVKHVCYATTRGWTYLNAANVDASPEVIAKARAYEARRATEAHNRIEEAVDAAPKKGDTVLINGYKRGKNVALNGQEAEIFWIGKNTYRPEQTTLGVTLNGAKFFVDADRAFRGGKDCQSLINDVKFERGLANAIARPSF